MKTLHAARHDGLDSILPWRNVCLSLLDYLSVYLGQLCGSMELRYLSVVLRHFFAFLSATSMTYKWANAPADLDQMLGHLCSL